MTFSHSPQDESFKIKVLAELVSYEILCLARRWLSPMYMSTPKFLLPISVTFFGAVERHRDKKPSLWMWKGCWELQGSSKETSQGVTFMGLGQE